MTTLTCKWFSSATVLIFVATPAFAAAGGEAGSLFSSEMLFKGINFAILLFLLYRFARKPIARMLTTSAVNAKQTIDTTAAELEEAQRQLASYRVKIADLERELGERQQSAIATIEAEKRQIIEDAQQQVARLEEQTRKRIEQDIAKAKETIKAFLVEESVRLAKIALTKEIGTKEQKALIEHYTKQLKKTA
jgi:F-type H+-transporting ATPase subunit b